ncbi:hypothetical protein, variant 3 [Aphanomyces invadans]|uniref:Cap-specific mRNA (nucleoside-2'-O-)-methyltransferase 1 n=1 Tax=Aphanomyces invadans TaxID=157072 RepID=A0A024TY74_9STRA|nr:hypothetical protein, variant 2 [Aphanomyces invadans]XP_008873181.1 hypothetical protein, variant 3 [Aphanomyces invadans]ETV98301.1 hypothetical protein, variant 2 [Aphanomyces invadans]ETV98302.1 hypothetical protein, variant 3 [Aphanomyces invadans]|eukprot:XP_008873176.1 hypothetical protein, variant 2 [Aphanomyces invadans]
MEDLLGFASFGKRKRSSASRKQHTKAAKIEYVPEPIEVLCGKSMPCLSHDTLGTVLDSTAAEPPALLLLELAEALKSLLSAKQNLHDKRLSPAEYRVARALANPWESLGKWKFVNRSAMKMAELDARLNLTREFIADGHLSFVDLCGAPGGFSEYLAFRANYREVRGHGISLRVPGMSHLNWQLPPAVQDVVSVLYGADGTGDLYKQENIEHFVHSVLETHSSGVNLVVADGGFQDARNHENQEQVMHRLVLCEVLVMCRVLRSGGHFVCKTFELSSTFSLGLLWVLHHLFDELMIVKPVVHPPSKSTIASTISGRPVGQRARSGTSLEGGGGCSSPIKSFRTSPPCMLHSTRVLQERWSSRLS